MAVEMKENPKTISGVSEIWTAPVPESLTHPNSGLSVNVHSLPERPGMERCSESKEIKKESFTKP